MDWIEISVEVDGEAAEAVTELFNRLNRRPDGQGGAVTEVSGFDAVGEAHDLKVTVRTYLPADEPETPALRRQIEHGLWFLGTLYPVPDPAARVLAEEDWANAWKAHYAPVRVGRHFLIIPAWQQADMRPRPDQQPIVLDPGMAFGTGLHPSTQLCLIALEDLPVAGRRVLDAGCGSGVLSIAAARLGAARVDAFDVDPMAVRATRENAALNGLTSAVHVFASSGPDRSPRWTGAGRAGAAPPEPPRWDVILVNILLPVIVTLLGHGLAGYLAPGGEIVLAGVIATQEDTLREELAKHALVAATTRRQGDWVSVSAGAPGNRVRSFFVAPAAITGDEARLVAEQAHRIRRVLRLRIGERVRLLDNQGWAYTADLVEYLPAAAVFRLLDRRPAGGEPVVHITLYQAVLKGEHTEWALQKCTEVGASAFVPVTYDRSVAGAPSALAARQERWRRILREAAEQCGRGRIPEIFPIVRFSQALASLTYAGGAALLRLLPFEGEMQTGLRQALTGRRLGVGTRVEVFVGPEGGLTDVEVGMARQHGVLPVSLGPRILRAETAGVAVVAAVLFAAGDLDPVAEPAAAAPAQGSQAHGAPAAVSESAKAANGADAPADAESDGRR